MDRGFTLIELLVTVLIIGILAAIALPKYETAVEKARMTEAVSNVKTIFEASERHRLATGKCPDSIGQLDINIDGERSYHPEFTPELTLTQYFAYGVVGYGSICQTFAERLPLRKKYQIYIENSDKRRMLCYQPEFYTPNDIQKKLCKDFNEQYSL